MIAPVVPLEDMQALTPLCWLWRAHDEINTLRRHLTVSRVGIGQSHPSRVLSLILSDVVSSPLEAIGLGTVLP